MNQATTINQLFQNAHDDGALSAGSLNTLTNLDLGEAIQAGLGVSVHNVPSSEVVLVTLMVDDSSSIRFTGNTQHVINGHNLVLNALLGTKQSPHLLMHTCYLNGAILFPYQPLSILDPRANGRPSYIQNPDIRAMDGKNYHPTLGTPLYDQTVVLLGRVLAKYQEFADNGVMTRTVTLIITDGDDQHSVKATEATVRTIIEDMLNEHHIIAAMGIDDRQTDFRGVFQRMGIRDEWILTPGNSAPEIHQAFQMFSQSAVRASQGGVRFSQTALGGFGGK